MLWALEMYGCTYMLRKVHVLLDINLKLRSKYVKSDLAVLASMHQKFVCG